MSEESASALIALFIASLPIIGLAIVLVGFVLAVVAIFAFLHLLEQPIRCWFYYISILFNLLLMSVAGVFSFLIERSDPNLWSEVELSVMIFCAVIWVPTVILSHLCDKAKKKDA